MLCAVSSKSRADLGSTDFGSCTKLLTESGTGSASTSFVICADRPFIDVIIVPILPSIVFLPASSAAFSSAVPVPLIPGGLIPADLRKFNAPLRLTAFVPKTTPIRPTKAKETAPKIKPRDELSAAAAIMIGMVAFNDGDALRFANRLGTGLPDILIVLVPVRVPERLIVLIKEGEKLPDTEIESDIVGNRLFVSDNDLLAVLPGEGESVLLIEEEKD